jgi:hypothetical protein
MMPTFEYDKRLSCRGPKAWRDLALHEAGHAVAFVRRGREFLYVTINPHDGPGGHLYRYDNTFSVSGYKFVGRDVVKMSQKEWVRQLKMTRLSPWLDPKPAIASAENGTT